MNLNKLWDMKRIATAFSIGAISLHEFDVLYEYRVRTIHYNEKIQHGIYDLIAINYTCNWCKK